MSFTLVGNVQSWATAINTLLFYMLLESLSWCRGMSQDCELKNLGTLNMDVVGCVIGLGIKS